MLGGPYLLVTRMTVMTAVIAILVVGVTAVRSAASRLGWSKESPLLPLEGTTWFIIDLT